MKIFQTRRDFIRLAGAVSLAGALPGATRVFAQSPSGGPPLKLDASWRILLAVKPSSSDAFAARELQRYVHKMTGWKWDVVQSDEAITEAVVIGRHPKVKKVAANLDMLYGKSPDAFVRLAGNRTFVMIGTSELATAFAVWSWLESLGVRWFFPTEKGEYVPALKSLQVEAGEHFEAPALEYRHIWPWATGDQLKPEYFGTVKDGIADWNLHQLHMKVWSETNPFSVEDRFRNLGWGHSYAHFLPAGQYFDQHPEWFNLIGGTRRKDQLCFTNAEAAHQFAENIRTALANSTDGDPRRRVVWVSPNDNRAWCECPNCQKLVDKDGSATSMVFNFTNLVARDLAKDHPEINLQCFAYANYSTAPDHITLEPAVTPILTYWVPSESFNFNITRPALSEGNAKFLKAYPKWSELSRQFGVYQYYGHYIWFAPLPVATQMDQDLKGFSKNPKFIGFSCEYHSNWATQGIGMYQLSKLSWDPSQNIEKLLRDYCEKGHGAAAEPMFHYYDTLQKGMDAAPYVSGDFWEVPNVLTAGVISECDRSITTAEALLPKMDEGTRWRTEMVCQGWRMSSAFAQAVLRYVQGGGVSDAQFMREKMGQVNQVLDSSWGPYMADATCSLPYAKSLIARFAVPLEALPVGNSKYNDSMNKGGLTRFYGQIKNLAPYDWGLWAGPNAGGSLSLPIKAVAGHQIKRIKMLWSTQGANAAVRYEMRIVTGKGEATLKETDFIGKDVELPADLLPAAEVTLEIKVTNSSDSGTLSLYGCTLDVDVE